MPMPDGMLRVDSDGTVLLKLRVHPGAKRSAVNGVFGNALKIDLQAPPVDGKANAALIKFLADKLQLSKAAVSVKSGECSRDKVIKISGAVPDQIVQTLNIEC